MTASAILILVTQLVTLLTAAFAAFKAWRGEVTSKTNSAAIQQLEIRVDGRLTQVLELSGKLSRLEGREEGREEGAARPVLPANQSPIAVEVVKITPVAVKESIPIEIKKD